MCVPDDEVAPEPQLGECVVFTSHFARGFGLPASSFFRRFLDYFRMQPHHLGANVVMLLSSFVCFCEGYLGIRPSIGLWLCFFHFRSQMLSSGPLVPNPKAGSPEMVQEKVMADCGAVSIYPNKTDYPNPKPLQSVKKWQRTFFYVRTTAGEEDSLNLPPFRMDPPEQRHNWQSRIVHGDTDLDEMVKHTKELRFDGLEATDLVAAWILR